MSRTYIDLHPVTPEYRPAGGGTTSVMNDGGPHKSYRYMSGERVVCRKTGDTEVTMELRGDVRGHYEDDPPPPGANVLARGLVSTRLELDLATGELELNAVFDLNRAVDEVRKLNVARMKTVASEVARRLFDIKSKGRIRRSAQVLLSEAQVPQLVELGYQAGYAAGLEAGRKATQAQLGKALGLRP